MLTTAALASAQGCSAVLYLLVARQSTPATYGSAMTSIGIAMVLASLVDFGTNALVIRQVAAQSMTARDFVQRYFSKTSIVMIAAGLYTASIVGSGVFGDGSALASIGILTVVIAVSQMSLAPLRAQSRVQRLAAATVIDKLMAATVAIALLVVGHLTSSRLWLCLLAGGIISTGVALRSWPDPFRAALWRSLRHPRESFMNPWRDSLHLGLSSVVLSLQALDIAVVNLSAGSHAAGVFSAVNRWTYPLGIVASGYTQATYPYVARAADHKSALRSLLHGWWMLPMLVGAVAVVVAAAPRLVVVLLGPGYRSSAGVLQALAVGLLPALINQPLCMFLQARRRERWSSTALATAIPLQLAAIWLLGRRYGAAGAAYGLLAAQLPLLALLLFLVSRSERPPQ